MFFSRRVVDLFDGPSDGGGAISRGPRVCCREDGAGRNGDGKERLPGRNDGEFEVHGRGRVPPARLEGCTVVTGLVVDILPLMNDGASSAWGVQVDVNRSRVQAGSVPADGDGLAGIDRLTLGRRLVETAG